ncbi:EAL domain-containing protein [Paraburkholderia sp. Ac-20336]|uniref:EAL domain-containing protein n=1 Tax=unclassified Paraburkholderia TaxID=2615204 RepID=UPI00141FD353|nr:MULTISPECIES: EAL domain-containing protein [unclassified Paraburkholderia]MBN3801826.1 EAL domain-containing protein [Paraburkholderia sp. Ac-20336]NIF81694.1 EAL domain-containing protein [Paraburkholderia sp. Cy-641]
MIQPASSTPSACHYHDGWLDMVIRITNLKEIERRYQKMISRAMDIEFFERIRGIVDDQATICRVDAGCIRVTGMLKASMSLSRTHACIEMLLRHIASAHGLLPLAALDVTVERPDGRPHTKVVRIPASEGRMHLAHATEVLNAMAHGHLALSLQPIFNVGEQDRSLYDECLARVILPESHCAMMPSSFIPSIERALLMNEFDQIVVSSVIDRLAADDTLMLGCNISAASAALSHWWTAIIDRLKRRPDIARRLVLEITETAPLKPAEAQEFSRCLNRLGCKVAIDDFGSRYGTQNAIDIGTPDIIKLDTSFLTDAKDTSHGFERLHRMTGLARTVVIEGVEDEMDLDIVTRAGFEWAQGHLHGEVESAMLHQVPPAHSR